MMAGNGVIERVDTVQILHAGEDVKCTIQPLALLLEEHLKLGEQVDYRRHFKQDTPTNIANHIADSISTGSVDKGVVLVFSERFNTVFSTNPGALDRIKAFLSQESCVLKVALVSTGGSTVLFSKPSIGLSSYAAKIDDGALAEAIYQQWFGPEARLTSQAEMSMNGLVISDAAQDKYAPCKVTIIHAIQDPELKMLKRRLSDAIDAVVDPEETTSSRIKFKSDQTIAKTVVGDMECFECCARGRVCKVHAVFVWCKFMLSALQQDQEAKNKVLDIVCRDTTSKKLFAHFLIGVTQQEISMFSPVLAEFLTRHGHTVTLESFNHHGLDYMPFAKAFLTIWAGSIKVPKDPEESVDPTMTSLESEEALPPPLASQKQETRSQHPHQNNTGDRLVINDGSIAQSDAVRTRQVGKALADFNPSNAERMVISNGSWDPQLGKVMNCSRGFQPDGHSNPPEDWSRHHTLHSVMEDPSSANREVAPVRQATDNVDGKNRMAAGSIDSVSVNCVTGPKTTNEKILPTSSEPSADRGAYSLPPSGGQQRLVQQKGQQPSSRVLGENCGKNKFAASGCMSWSVDGSSRGPESSMNQSGVDDPAASVAGPRDLDGSASSSLVQGDNLSVGANPVRKTSDYDVLTSADAHQLDDAMKTLCISSHGAAPFMTGNLQSLPSRSDFTGSTSLGQSELTGTRTMPPSSDVSNWTSGLSDGRQSVSFRQQESTDRVMSVPEGRNPLQDGASTSTCGSVSLPYPGATSNAAQARLPSLDDTNGVQTQAGREAIGQQAREDTLLCDLDQPIIRGLKILLDPLKQTVADWQDLASHLGVSNVIITYWKGQKSDSSPFEQLLTWLKTEKQNMTVKDLKELLKKVTRLDVLRFLIKEGY